MVVVGSSLGSSGMLCFCGNGMDAIRWPRRSFCTSGGSCDCIRLLLVREMLRWKAVEEHLRMREVSSASLPKVTEARELMFACFGGLTNR